MIWAILLMKTLRFYWFCKKSERPPLFTGVILVQDDRIVFEILELEFLHPRYDLSSVVTFSENIEIENEDRIIPVYRNQSVITALINVDDVIAVIHRVIGHSLANTFYHLRLHISSS